MPKRIFGRPLLPWWVYIGYFLIAAAVVIWNHAAHGEEMKPATGKTAEKAKHGRKGDTRLAHINPFEEAILKALGGSGTTNPKTGYKEYFSEGVVGGDNGVYDSGGQGPGMAPEAGYDAALGGFGGVYDSGDQGPGQAPPPGQPDNALGSLGQSRNGIESYLNKNAHFAMMPSFMAIPALGFQALNNYAFGGNARADFPQNSSGGARDDAIMNALGAQPVAAPPPAQYARPAEQMPPPSLGLAGGLTDLQRRAQIATGGSQGQSGVYRTPEAMRYYGQLIAKALIGDNGQAQENSNILPVEQQYLRQVYGINNSDKAGTLLEALRPYWSR